MPSQIIDGLEFNYLTSCDAEKSADHMKGSSSFLHWWLPEQWTINKLSDKQIYLETNESCDAFVKQLTYSCRYWYPFHTCKYFPSGYFSRKMKAQIIIVCVVLISWHSSRAANARKNVLFLAVDDMRPELGCFLGGDFPSPVHPKMHSPNLDKLASKSLLLKRAYVQTGGLFPKQNVIAYRWWTVHTQWNLARFFFSFLPARSEGWVVMFLHLFVCPGGGGSASFKHASLVTWAEGSAFWGGSAFRGGGLTSEGVCPEGVCIKAGPWDMASQWSVRILLECNLVNIGPLFSLALCQWWWAE